MGVSAGVAEPTELGLRERKKRQTRNAIREAAVHLVADRGLERVTVDEIAQAANVSPRTFFNYFRSKEDALAGIDKDDIEEACAALRARPADEPPLRALAAVLTNRLERQTVDPRANLARAQMHQSHPQLFGAHAATWRRFELSLAEVIAERTGLSVDEHPYPTTVVAVAMAVVRSTISHWQRTENPSAAALSEKLRAGFDNVERGLAPPTPGQPLAPGQAPTPGWPGTAP
ncbi:MULTISPECIES: TetR/AcrR family transcriptional regulator [Pseudofrankia]|uniref:TetR/AcrR family transcriptional regulator n=1 Tax=Pseudofrankia TaxID=2994363 RepID=UPI000234D953|nr:MULTISPECIES: TetR/AcrR family transcriptional regulator [Pseudofrankia]